MTDTAGVDDQRPAIFISHRHADHEIARQLQLSLRDLLGETVRIYNTSDERADGFKLGGQLSTEIRSALSASSLVILLYTTDDADWRWCFFECGVANDPTDDVGTTTVVLDFGTERGTKVFDGDLHLSVVPLETHDDPSPADFRRFIAELGTGTHAALANAPSRASGHRTEEEIYAEADDLYRRLNEIGPTTQAQLTKDFHTALTSVPAEYRRMHFQPLFQGAADALRWGLRDETGLRDLFITYWNDRLLKELTNLSQRRLTFPPGRVYLDWENLLQLCRRLVATEANRDRVLTLGRPVLALVSQEAHRLADSESKVNEFWLKARKRGTDASFYENPIRNFARKLYEEFGDSVKPAERIFVIDRNRFSEEAAEQLAAVATWMGSAHISTVVTFEDRRRAEDRFDDFGIVGWTAVSRFSIENDRPAGGDNGQATDRTSYRSLVEDFSDTEIEAAEKAWRAIPRLYEWSPPGDCDPAEMYKVLTEDN